MFSDTGSLMETWAQQSGYVDQQAPEREREICLSSALGLQADSFMMWKKQTLVLMLLWEALYGHSYFPSLV